jgi:hypothetical protein
MFDSDLYLLMERPAAVLRARCALEMDLQPVLPLHIGCWVLINCSCWETGMAHVLAVKLNVGASHTLCGVLLHVWARVVAGSVPCLACATLLSVVVIVLLRVSLRLRQWWSWVVPSSVELVYIAFGRACNSWHADVHLVQVHFSFWLPHHGDNEYVVSGTGSTFLGRRAVIFFASMDCFALYDRSHEEHQEWLLCSVTCSGCNKHPIQLLLPMPSS